MEEEVDLKSHIIIKKEDEKRQKRRRKRKNKKIKKKIGNTNEGERSLLK